MKGGKHGRHLHITIIERGLIIDPHSRNGYRYFMSGDLSNIAMFCQICNVVYKDPSLINSILFAV